MDTKWSHGRLQNEKGEWVWNGEDYDFVMSHQDWLPLVFLNRSDEDKFEKMEKIWKAEQIYNNPSSSAIEKKTALRVLNNLGAKVKHSDMNDSMTYTYLYHSGKGEERKGHKYSAREWVGKGWRYFYDDVLGYGHKKKAEKAMRDHIDANHEYTKAIDDNHKALDEVKDKSDYKKYAQNQYYLTKKDAAKAVKKYEDEYNIVADAYGGYKRDAEAGSEYDREQMLKIIKQIPDISAKYKNNVNNRNAANDAIQKHTEAEKNYRLSRNKYEQSKIKVSETLDRIRKSEIRMTETSNVHDKEIEAYNKSVASKIDKGLELINGLLKKIKK